MLLFPEVHRQGLAASDDEIRYAARNNPPPAFQQSPAFQTNGQFDIQKYQAVLNNPNVDPQFFTQLEGYLRETLPIEKLTSLVYGTAVVSDAEVKQLFLDRS